jgi:hypothetical protein
MTLTITSYHRTGALIIRSRPFASQHAPLPGSGLASDCEDLYAIAQKTNRRSAAALAGSPGVGLEPAEDLSSAIVNR